MGSCIKCILQGRDLNGEGSFRAWTVVMGLSTSKSLRPSRVKRTRREKMNLELFTHSKLHKLM